MTAYDRFQQAFGGSISSENHLSMPLIMTFASRWIGVTYKDYLQDPTLQARAQFETAKAFGIDTLGAISDPVTELSSMGGAIVWFEDDPPAPDPLTVFLSDYARLDDLRAPDPRGNNRMGLRLQAIQEMKRLSDHQYPVMGWVEGPISMAAVMRGMTNLMEDLIDDPEVIHRLFTFCVDVAMKYAAAQVDFGADFIGFGDAPASLIGPSYYQELVLPYEQEMIRRMHELGVPVRMHICGNTTKLFPYMAQSGADIIDIDSIADFGLACDQIPSTIHLLGNLDPVREVLNGEPIAIRERIDECRALARDRYVIGAGCEIPARTPHANLAEFRSQI